VQWLFYSLIASVVLTVVANLAIRALPGPSERGARRLQGWAEQQHDGRDEPGGRVRVIVPWKAMIVASIVLTILLNVVLRVAR